MSLSAFYIHLIVRGLSCHLHSMISMSSFLRGVGEPATGERARSLKNSIAGEPLPEQQHNLCSVASQSDAHQYFQVGTFVFLDGMRCRVEDARDFAGVMHVKLKRAFAQPKAASFAMAPSS